MTHTFGRVGENDMTNIQGYSVRHASTCLSPVAWPPPWLTTADAAREGDTLRQMKERGELADAGDNQHTRLSQAATTTLDAVPPTPAVNLPPAVCRCGSVAWQDFPIHGGRSTRRDCAVCGKFLSFIRWCSNPSRN
jgi:hypothetical protein